MTRERLPGGGMRFIVTGDGDTNIGNWMKDFHPGNLFKAVWNGTVLDLVPEVATSETSGVKTRVQELAALSDVNLAALAAEKGVKTSGKKRDEVVKELAAKDGKDRT